jgi:hypothetical protein
MIQGIEQPKAENPGDHALSRFSWTLLSEAGVASGISLQCLGAPSHSAIGIGPGEICAVGTG